MRPAPEKPAALRDWDFERVTLWLTRAGRMAGGFDPRRLEIICEAASEILGREIKDPDEINEKELAELASRLGGIVAGGHGRSPSGQPGCPARGENGGKP